MSSIAAAPAVSRRAVNPWLVAAAVVVPTFMEVLDTTIANVALRYIAGGLSAAVVDSEWVITSYLAANATVLPLSGWISARLGRRNYFLLSIAVFTIASGLCGMATSLGQIICFRVLQGLAGGGLQPSSQGILLDSFPPEKQGTAMTMFGLAALIGPIVGPTLGGYLTDTYNWRWIFYVNIPVGTVAVLAAYFLVDDPDYLKQQRAELRKQPLNFDAIGLGLLAIAISSWEVILSKGQQWDWLGDPFWRVQSLLVLLIVCGACFVFRETKIANPIVSFRPMRERNYLVSCAIIFSAYAVLYAASVSLPSLLQVLLGYDAFRSGLVMSPSGIGSICVLIVVGALLGRGLDALADRLWTCRAGIEQSLDGLYESRNQSLPCDLAASGIVVRAGNDLRPAQPGRLSLYAQGAAWSGGRANGLAAQRGRQLRHLDGANIARSTRSASLVAIGGVSRSAQSGRQLLSGAIASGVLPANRRFGSLAANVLAVVGRSSRSASVVAFLL